MAKGKKKDARVFKKTLPLTNGNMEINPGELSLFSTFNWETDYNSKRIKIKIFADDDLWDSELIRYGYKESVKEVTSK